WKLVYEAITELCLLCFAYFYLVLFISQAKGSNSSSVKVLACLRSLIRKCTYQNFASNELVKLFPPDLPLDLQQGLQIDQSCSCIPHYCCCWTFIFQ
ncbi:hypothetical protein S245_036749, partial [Arachis hypogaea]